MGAEDRDAVSTGEDSGRHGTAHERDELAADRQERPESEQAHHRVHAVVGDLRREARGDAREEHREDSTYACEDGMRTPPGVALPFVEMSLVEIDAGWDFKVLIV